MARLTREQQKDYEAELEYSRNRPIHIPDKHNPSVMDRIVHAANRVGTKIQEANNSPTGQAIRRHAERLNAQDGFGGGGYGGWGAPPQQEQRSVREHVQRISKQPRVQVRETSKKARRHHPLSGGGLGLGDNGFDDDRGL